MLIALFAKNGQNYKIVWKIHQIYSLSILFRTAGSDQIDASENQHQCHRLVPSEDVLAEGDGHRRRHQGLQVGQRQQEVRDHRGENQHDKQVDVGRRRHRPEQHRTGFGRQQRDGYRHADDAAVQKHPLHHRDGAVPLRESAGEQQVTGVKQDVYEAEEKSEWTCVGINFPRKKNDEHRAADADEHP